MSGLGDTIEKVLTKFGINQEKIEKIIGGRDVAAAKEKLGSIKYFLTRKSTRWTDNYDEMSDGQLADKFIESRWLKKELTMNMLYFQDNEEGLGTAIESALSKMGITPERIQRVFGLSECGCKERKRFLNRLFPFFKKTTEEDG